MPELFILAAFMVGTLLLLAGLMVIFRSWMIQRDTFSGGAGDGTQSHGPSGH
jgi:hypothetical protein